MERGAKETREKKSSHARSRGYFPSGVSFASPRLHGLSEKRTTRSLTVSWQIPIYYEHDFSCFFFTSFSEILRPPLIFLVPSLGWNWRKWRHFLKNIGTWVEIIITISTAIRIQKTLLPMRYIWHHFLKFSRFRTRKINGGRNSQKPRVLILNFVIDWNLSR